MRKTMTKEVTHTTVKLAKMVQENGQPKAIQLPDEIILGNVSLEKARKLVSKKYSEPVTVFAVEPDTVRYELDVEKFLEIATPVRVEDEKEDDKATAVTSVK